VLISRGSVIPMFHEQIRNGGPVTVTTTDMTRFLLSLDRAVDTIFAALTSARRSETFVPRVASARILDLAQSLIGQRPVEVQVIGIRPGEKIHESLISEEEGYRSIIHSDDYYVIQAILPELVDPAERRPRLDKEYSSADRVLSREELDDLLKTHRLRIEDKVNFEAEMSETSA
jgi:UDP-glucose 4-epimerase